MSDMCSTFCQSSSPSTLTLWTKEISKPFHIRSECIAAFLWWTIATVRQQYHLQRQTSICKHQKALSGGQTDHISTRNSTNKQLAGCHLSRVCAVAQYAVLEANGKVNGIGEISHPSPSPTLRPIWMSLQIYHYVPPGSQCAKFD